MKKIAILLIICLAITALAGCARADQRKEEFATLTQPEQIIQKDEIAEKEEPIESDLKDEPDTDEPNRSNSGTEEIKKQPILENSANKEDVLEKESDKHQIVYGSVPVGAQYELSSLPRFADRCVGVQYLYGNPLEFKELQALLDPQTSIVFRGKVNGKSTQYESGGASERKYNETPVLVEEVYYGNVKVGEVVNCYEDMFVHLHDGEPVLEHYGIWGPLEKNEEYLFMLHKSEPLHEEGEEIYVPKHSDSPYIRIGELEQLQSKKNLSTIEQRNLDALTYYLGQRGEDAE